MKITVTDIGLSGDGEHVWAYLTLEDTATGHQDMHGVWLEAQADPQQMTRDLQQQVREILEHEGQPEGLFETLRGEQFTL